MIFKIILLCLAISLFPDYGHTAIYGYIADDGVYHYTNMIPIGKKISLYYYRSDQNQSWQKISIIPITIV